MYVGTVYDFFYKPKNWIFQQPKFNQKKDNAYININGRIFSVNELTGEMTLCSTIPKKINFPKSSEKPNKLKIKNKLSINSIKKTLNDNTNYKDTFLNTENIKSISARDSKLEGILHSSKNLDIKNKKTITLENISTDKNNYLKNIISNNNKIKKLSTNKSLDPNHYSSNIYNISTNSNSLKFSQIQNSLIKKEKLKTILYFNKTNKKYFKPHIAFGQKVLKSLSFGNKNKKHSNSNSKKKKNLLYLMYKQHKNNISGEGRINEKIYDKENDDNLIFKTYKDQIFKDKIINGLKRKYHFYVKDNDSEIKVPLITYKNNDFYRGYSFSDNKRVPIHHKLFFEYIKRDKIKEIEEYENEHRQKNKK